jgi:hypothetical protein
MGCHEGDVVAIVPTRPMSKDIRWRVVRVLGRKALPEGEIDTAAGKPARPAAPAPTDSAPASAGAPATDAREANKAS